MSEELDTPAVWTLEYEGHGDFRLLLNGREAFWLGVTKDWQQGDSDHLAAVIAAWNRCAQPHALTHPETSGQAEGMPPISFDGPHPICEHRAWLARQLLDSKLSDDEAYGIVRYSPAINPTHDKARSGSGRWRQLLTGRKANLPHRDPRKRIVGFVVDEEVAGLSDGLFMLEELVAALDGGWRPIETAPRDGTRVDLWAAGVRWPDCRWGRPGHICNPEDGGPSYCDHCPPDEDVWCCNLEMALGLEPTHWMPLPSPPNPTTQAEGGAG